MVDPASILTAGTEALSLTAQLARLIEENQRAPEPARGLGEIIARLRPEALSIARSMASVLRSVIGELEDLGVDTRRSVNDLLEDFRWYDFRAKSRLRAVEGNLIAMHQQLARFVDDVGAVYICAGTVQDLGGAAIERLETKRGLDATIWELRWRPIRDVVDQLIRVADNLQARLEDTR